MIDFNKTYDVVVVGGGPVGFGLAIDLGQRGHSVAVVERSTELHQVPKGQNLTQRTMEHFNAWGCEPEVRAARIVPRDYAIGGMTSYKTLLSGYHYDWLQRDMVRPFYACENERLPQYRMEAVLRARAEAIEGIDIGYGLSCASVEQESDGATVHFTDTEQTAHSLRARYVVGSDGSNSRVRRSVGIEQTKNDFDKRMVLLVFKSLELHELLKCYPDKQFYCVLNQELQGYWLFFGRVDLGTTWFFHAPVPAETTTENFDFKGYLERSVGEKIDVEFDYIGFWDLRVALADEYRAGRVFIAGDACHSHPPYGGYGVNTGLEDSRNLGWKLSALLSGWGSEALLDSYGEERHPVFKSTADHFIERFIREDRAFLNAHSPEALGEEAFRHAWDTRNEGSSEVMAFAPNYDGSSIVWGDDAASPSAVGTHERRARAGHHLTPMPLADSGNAFEVLGAGFTLFVSEGDGGAAADQFSRAAERLGVPLTVVGDGTAEALQGWEAEAVLVRPDSYVAWAGAPGEVAPLNVLARAVGRAAA